MLFVKSKLHVQQTVAFPPSGLTVFTSPSRASATHRCVPSSLTGVEKVDLDKQLEFGRYATPCCCVDGWTAPIAVIPLRREVASNITLEIS